MVENIALFFTRRLPSSLFDFHSLRRIDDDPPLRFQGIANLISRLEILCLSRFDPLAQEP